MDIGKANIMGAALALLILVLCILIFIVRLNNLEKLEYWLGIVFMLTAVPLVYLMIKAKAFDRPGIYYIQIGAMLTFIFLELVLDYILNVDFRNIRWMTITYVMIFFAGTGGMIGLASLVGKIWTICAIVLFFATFGLAFYQHAKTGV